MAGPCLIGAVFLGACALYEGVIPAQSSLSWFKYLNFFGLLKTGRLYGQYLNLNMLGYPLSRLQVSLLWLSAGQAVAAALSASAFQRGRRLTLRPGKRCVRLPFCGHTSLFLHEGYKIWLRSGALWILLLFAVLVGGRSLSASYKAGPSQRYYQSLLLRLEGGLTGEKEALLRAEEERAQAAFEEIERIDAEVAAGRMDWRAGEAKKAPYYNETAYYEVFKEAWRQYEHVKQEGGVFFFDTGFLYLLGLRGNRGQ